MDTKLEKLIEDYFPNDKTAAESLLQTFSSALCNDMKKYADTQYRRYLSLNKQDDWYLGASEGADKCVEIINKMLD